MQHLPDIEVGSGDMLTERDTFGAPPDLQRLGEARGRQKILGSIRRSPTTCVSRAWAVLLTALAVATLLTKCFRVFGGWSRYEDRGRRLAGGNSEPPDDPDTRAIVDLCLEMEEIDPVRPFRPLPPLGATTTAGTALGGAPQALNPCRFAYQAPQSDLAPQPTGPWGLQSRSLLGPSHGVVVNSAPATFGAGTALTYSAPLYRLSQETGPCTGTRVTWISGQRQGVHHSRPHVPAGHALGQVGGPAGKGASTVLYSRTPHLGFAGMFQTRACSAWSRALPTEVLRQEPTPVTKPSPCRPPQVSSSVEPSDAACHTDESDPEEGPSSGLRTLPTASTQAAQQENAKKRKWGPEGLSSTSVVTTHVSTPAPKKRATSLLEELLFPPETPESLQPVAFPNPKQHLFYRLPRLTPSAVRTSFCVPFAFSSNKLLTVPYYGILALRNFLAKEAVIGKEVTSAIRASERLVNCLFHYHVDTVTNLKPHEAVRVLGIRYLALDGLVAMLDLLGDAMHADDWWDGLVGVIPSDVRYNSPYLSLPLRSSNALLAIKLSDAIGKLKQRQRLSAGDTVELKQSLFCRYCSPAYFKNAKWNAWREDDSVSLEASYEQEWTAARERPVEEENKTKLVFEHPRRKRGRRISHRFRRQEV